MLKRTLEQMLLKYLSQVSEEKCFCCVKDVEALSSQELLTLAHKVEDQYMGLFVQLIKSSQNRHEMFQKLMGEHEETNRWLVDSFFSRYMKQVIPQEEDLSYYNPILLYLPPETFEDLAFVQSRQHFFLRQTAETINEYLSDVFDIDAQFVPGEQEKAWQIFWNMVVQADFAH
ncbi:MAG: hypothetical protein HQK83_02670 [Fibrobacteria bacterium]|nr:hypothetical protein [Fibrobacteria bacterium]